MNLLAKVLFVCVVLLAAFICLADADSKVMKSDNDISVDQDQPQDQGQPKPKAQVQPRPRSQSKKLSVGQGAQKQDAPKLKIKDIDAYRGAPLPFIRSNEEVVDLGLMNVDFNADVLAVIDGFEVTQELFRSHLVIFMGGMDVDRFITAMLADYGKKIRIKAGADPTKFEVSEDRVDRAIEAQKSAQEQFNQGAPKLSMEEYKSSIDATLGWDRFREIMRSMTVFERVFMPQIKEKAQDTKKKPEGPVENTEAAAESKDELDPNLPIVTDIAGEKVNRYIPEITWNVLSDREQTYNVRDMLNSQYKDGSPIMGILRIQFARTIKDAVLKKLGMEYFYSGDLNPGVLLKVGDMELKAADVYAVIKDKVTDAERMLALREILLCKAMDHSLKEAGCLFTPEERKQAYRDHEKQYEGTLFPVEFMAQVYGYINIECYKNIYYRRAAFEKMIKAEMNDPVTMEKFYESAARFLYEDGNVKLGAIFFGIYNSKEKKYREDGYAWAKSKAAEVMKRLEGGESFEALAREYMDVAGTFNTCEFPPLNRMYLRKTLGESPKSALISGFSMADYIFYRAKNKEVVGPIVNYWSSIGNPSHQGVYLLKVNEFTRAGFMKPFEEAKKTIEGDYCDLKFISWAQEALDGSDIQLTKK